MNIKSIITAAIALLISTACSGGAKQEKVMNKDGNSLVVFTSHSRPWEPFFIETRPLLLVMTVVFTT